MLIHQQKFWEAKNKRFHIIPLFTTKHSGHVSHSNHTQVWNHFVWASIGRRTFAKFDQARFFAERANEGKNEKNKKTKIWKKFFVNWLKLVKKSTKKILI